MNAFECIEKLSKTSLFEQDLRYCLVDEQKKPHKIDGELARPNNVDDFVSIAELLTSDKLFEFAGVGISIQASKITAIDVDHCFKEANNLESKDERASEILDLFWDKAYCEFSFSGTGLRVLFQSDLISDYSLKYYIKNEKNQIEFYQPTNSFRYVTLTGNTLYDYFSKVNQDTISAFLEKYMKRPVRVTRKVQQSSEVSFDKLQTKVKYLYLTRHGFQDLWFGKAPGSGKDESERDFHILAYLYEEVTQDKEMVKKLFEQSPYFKSKDWKHVKKWEQQEFRYFEYVFSQIEGRKSC